jgi:hypothetical protein
LEEGAKEDLGIDARAAGGSVGGDDAEGFEGVGLFDDELDGADARERGDGAAGNDGKRGREGGNGDEAEVSAAGEELLRAEGGEGVVKLVALGEFGSEGRVLEVPYEGSRIEEADGGYAYGI